MLGHTALYLQYTISFLIELVRESIPSKFQSAGLLLAAVGINIPNRSIISSFECNFTNSLCFLPAPSPFHHRSLLLPVSSPFASPTPTEDPKITPSKCNSLASLSPLLTQACFGSCLRISPLRRSEHMHV